MKQVTHVSGAVSKGEEVSVISTQWELDSNWHDLLAGVNKGMLKPRLREFFGDIEQFASYEPEHLDKLAQECARRVEEATKAANATASAGPVLRTAKLEMQEKARARRPPPSHALRVPLTAAVPPPSA